MLSKITEEQINQRIIVRRKSEILNVNSTILAWEASLVNNKNILLLCHQNNYAEMSDELNLKELEANSLIQQKKLSAQQFKLLLGPYECRKYKQHTGIDDLSALASILLDYAQIEHEKLKIDPVIRTKFNGNLKDDKSEIMKAIQSSPFARLVDLPQGKKQTHRRRQYGKNVEDKYAPYLEFKNQSKVKKQSSESNSESLRHDLIVEDNGTESNKVMEINGNSQQISEHISMMQASKNISEDIIGNSVEDQING